MFQREPYLAPVLHPRCLAPPRPPAHAAVRKGLSRAISIKHAVSSSKDLAEFSGGGLTLDISTWRLSAAACTASISAGAPAREAGALFLLQAWSTGVIAISRNSLVLLMPFILPRACCYSQGDLRTRYHFLPSLVFVAALQDELKASTSFLHLL